MAKPTDLPVHATDTNYPAGAEVEAGTAIKIEPAAPKQALGYRPGEKPKAQSFNWWMNLVYLWIVYLDNANPETRTFHVPLSGGNNAPPDDIGITGAGAWYVGIPAEGKTFEALVYADVVFTAANATEIFTKATHGLFTGDGPFQVSNSGGALPAGLAAATNYWIIKIDANTFYLATSLVNALLATHLSITTDGTGTQTLADTASTVRCSGRKISSIRARVIDSVTGPTRIRMTLYTLTSTVGTADITLTALGNVISTGTAGLIKLIELDLSALNTGIICPNCALHVKFDLSTGTDLCQIVSLEYDTVPIEAS